MTDGQRADIARSDAATRIMQDPMVQEALAAIEDGIVGAWKDLPLRDVEGREQMHRLLQAKRKFEQVFLTHMQNGKLVAAELRIEEERKSLTARFKEKIYG